VAGVQLDERGNLLASHLVRLAHHAPCSPQGVVDDPHLGTVGGHDDSAVAGRYTEPCEALREPAGAIGELADECHLPSKYSAS
jgi:hypothetical protein